MAHSNLESHNPLHRWPWALLFIGPCALGLLLFTYGPTLASFTLSFTYWNLLGTPEWVGLDNYLALIGDPFFWQVMANTLAFMVVCGFLEVCLGLFLANWLNDQFRSLGLLRTAYFLPFVTPMVSVALVWGWIYDPNNGFLNQLLMDLGALHEPLAFLQNPDTALMAIIAIEVWKMIGYNTVLFLAGLQGIPTDVYESASLDGASPWQRFWKITLPLVTPTLFFVMIMTFIHTLQAFDHVYLLTQGGPENRTSLMVYWLFKNAFIFYKIGPASAMAYVLFLLILLLTWLQWSLRKRWVMYEDEEGKAA